MSTQADPNELLSKVEDGDLRGQLEGLFNALSGTALRQQVDTLQDENKNLKATLRTNAFKDAGFDPNAGPGKALAKLYDGDPDPEAIKQFAKDEFGFEPGTGATTGGNDSQPSGEDNLNALSSGTIPPREPSIDDQIKKAEAEGDWDTYDVLQTQKIEALRAG